jgi:hypothetical protein
MNAEDHLISDDLALQARSKFCAAFAVRTEG